MHRRTRPVSANCRRRYKRSGLLGPREFEDAANAVRGVLPDDNLSLAVALVGRFAPPPETPLSVTIKLALAAAVVPAVWSAYAEASRPDARRSFRVRAG